MEKPKIRNIIVCLILTAAMLLGGCASENIVDTSSKADNGSNASLDTSDNTDATDASDTTDTSNEISDNNSSDDNLSDASTEVSDTSNGASTDVSDTSNDNGKEDQNTPENPTVTGEDVMNELREYLPGIYANRYYLSYDEAANRLQNVHYEYFGIDIYAGYDPTYDAGVGKFYDGYDFIPCVLWGAAFRDDYYGDQVLNVYIPPEHPAMIAIREKMGVAPNNLSKLMFTEEEILTLDSETAQLLLDVIEASKNYTVHKKPEN